MVSKLKTKYHSNKISTHLITFDLDIETGRSNSWLCSEHVCKIYLDSDNLLFYGRNQLYLLFCFVKLVFCNDDGFEQDKRNIYSACILISA